MSGAGHDPHEEAIEWMLQLRTADASGWRQFTAWLESDPRNAAAYDLVTCVGDGLVTGSGRSSAIVAAPVRSPLRILRPAAVAAALLAAAAGVALLAPPRRPGDLIASAPLGTLRSVALPDGSRITLAGGAQVRVSGEDRRKARLLTGSARFEVVHDVAHPFEVLLGGDRVVDVGTDFELTRDGGRNEVAVVSGAVLFNPDRQRLTLGPGDRLTAADGARAVEFSRSDPASIGGWARGGLTFLNAGAAEVASELSRATGLAVKIDPTLVGSRFTGRISLTDDGDALRRRVAAVLGVDVVPSAAGWQLTPAGRAPH